MSSALEPEPGRATAADLYEQVQSSEDFARLRQRFRSFIFPMTVLFLVWYFLYVLLAAFAPSFMATKVLGNVNIGLLLGLGQFVSTFVITTVYRRWADRRLDPEADALRVQVEEAAR